MKYLGTLKGGVIKCIAVLDLYKWSEIRDELGLTNDQLRPIIKELKSEGILEEKGSEFRVEYNLWLGYMAYFGNDWAKNKIRELEEDAREQERLARLDERRKRREAKNHLRNRMREWIKFKNIKVEPNCSHLYLIGENLASLVRDLIPLTKKEILVANPYVEKCTLCERIINVSNQGVEVTLITRSPYDDYNGRRKQAKIKFHETIKDSPIQFYYNNSVHAKLFILDDQVLSASSMNLYSESIAGKLWEAGIVTIHPTNINRAKKSFDQLLKHPETKLQK